MNVESHAKSNDGGKSGVPDIVGFLAEVGNVAMFENGDHIGGMMASGSLDTAAAVGSVAKMATKLAHSSEKDSGGGSKPAKAHH